MVESNQEPLYLFFFLSLHLCMSPSALHEPCMLYLSISLLLSVCRLSLRTVFRQFSPNFSISICPDLQLFRTSPLLQSLMFQDHSNSSAFPVAQPSPSQYKQLPAIITVVSCSSSSPHPLFLLCSSLQPDGFVVHLDEIILVPAYSTVFQPWVCYFSIHPFSVHQLCPSPLYLTLSCFLVFKYIASQKDNISNYATVTPIHPKNFDTNFTSLAFLTSPLPLHYRKQGLSFLRVFVGALQWFESHLLVL